MSSLFSTVRIVLVEPSHPGNIGAVARAMKTMGFSQLYLVNPSEYPHPQAVWRAANALDVLEQAQVVSQLTDAIGDCSLVIGTSSRQRRIPWPSYHPRELVEKVNEHMASSASGIAILFGRESSGLTNEELHSCHFHAYIPANPDYGVLNLAAAVQVICYELRMGYLLKTDAPDLKMDWDMQWADFQEVEHFFAHLEQVLIKMGFHDPSNPRQLMTRLRRLYLRAGLDKMEINILRGILTTTEQIVRKS